MRAITVALFAFAAALLAPMAAHAAPPVLEPLTVQVNQNGRGFTASWSLPPNMRGYLFEAASAPDTYADGDLKAQFLQENVFKQAFIYLTNPTTYGFERGPGKVWVHVLAYDEIACPFPLFPTCPKEVSNVQTAEILNSTPGMISAGHASRHLMAEWWKSVWHSNVFIEAATSPDVYTSGPLEGLFRDENLMLYDDTLSQDQRSFSSRDPLPPGTYWVHVATEDVSGCCGTDITAPLTVTIPSSPPVLRTASHRGRFLHADWSLPANMQSDFVEIAGSPAVYPDGPLAGYFLDQNLVFDDLLAPTQTSWDADRSLPDGLYYVHVGGLALGACPTPDALTCMDEFSQALPVRIGAAPTAPTAAAAAPDTSTAFASLSAARRMSARHLVVRARMGEAGSVTVNGNVSVPGASKVFRLKPVSAKTAPGKTVTLRPVLSKPALKSVRKALRRHRRVGLKLTVTARDAAGNIAVRKRTARLRR